MKLYSIKLPSLTLLLISTAYPALANRTKVVAVDYPPFINSKVQSKGLLIELALESFKRSNLSEREFDLQFQPFKRSFISMNSGEFPISIGTSMGFSKNDLKKIHAIVLMNTKIVLFYKQTLLKKDISFKDRKDLHKYKGLTAAVFRGSIVQPALEEAGINIVQVSNPKAQLSMLDMNRVDAAAVASLTGTEIIRNFFTLKKNIIKKSEGVLEQVPLHIMFSRSHPKYKTLLPAFTRGFKKLQASGDYLRILEKYYGKGRVTNDILTNFD